MISTLSESPANRILPSKPRAPLFSKVALFGFALLAAAPLLLMFQEKEITQKVMDAKLGDPVTVGYLTNLLRTDPNNFELRVRLAEHNMYLGEINAVPKLLYPVLGDEQSEWYMRAALLYLDYLARLVDAKANDPTAVAMINVFRHNRAYNLMQQLLAHPDSKNKHLPERLALYALQLHEPDWAEKLYRSVAQSNAHEDADWYAQIAARMVNYGQYRQAAEFYFMARQKALTRIEQKKYFFLGINILMSDSLFKETMLAADKYLGNLSNDSEALYFLAKTALAANDTQRAQRYAKELLHMTWQKDVPRRLSLWRIELITPALADEEVGHPDAAGIKPYNSEQYELAFNVFLANRNLDDAFRVADAAVRQVPSSVIWHQRLAQVSEWSGKPDMALKEWQWVMDHSHSQSSMMAILRLAPGMQDYGGLLDTWKYIATQKPLDAVQISVLSGLFEQTDRVNEGIVFFTDRYQKTHEPAWLARVAYLAERAGDEITAQSTYQQLLEHHDLNRDALFRIATYELKNGRTDDARQLLLKYRDKIEPDDHTYWKLLADISWLSQQDKEAKIAYQKLLDDKKLAIEDISRYIYLLGDNQKEQSASLSEFGYEQFSSVDMLTYALETYATLHDSVARKRLFENAVYNDKINLQGNATFFLLRAQFRHESGMTEAARQDFIHAVSIAPNNRNMLDALFWFLIDTHDQTGIMEMMASLNAKHWQQEKIFLAAFAAGYQVLEQPKQALRYYQAALKTNQHDFLWLVNYAAAQEQAGEAAAAIRTRRHAWQLMRDQSPTISMSLPLTPKLQAVLSLALMNNSQQRLNSLIRNLMRQDRLIDQSPADGEIFNQAVLGWMISTQQTDHAKAWLWLRYAHILSQQQAQVGVFEMSSGTTMNLKMSDELMDNNVRVTASADEPQPQSAMALLLDTSSLRNSQIRLPARSEDPPVWATSLLSLQELDAQQLDKLFQHEENKIPIGSRSDAAQVLGSMANAQDIAFNGLTGDPSENELQERLLNYGLATSSFVESTLNHQQFSSWSGTQGMVTAEMPFSSSTRIGVLLSNTLQTNSDPTILTPAQEHIQGLRVKTQESGGLTDLQWQHRQEFASTDALLVDQSWQVNDRLALQGDILYHADTLASVPLLTIGMQNKIGGSATYRLGLREFLSLQAAGSDYFTQQGLPLGRGNELTWLVGYHTFLGYPDWDVSLHGFQQNVSPLPTGINFLPPTSQLYSLCSNLGMSIQTQYTHAWLPYSNTCLTTSPQYGTGYNVELGWVGSLLGHDQATVSMTQGMSSAITSQGLTRELMFRYRYYFDQH